MITAIIVLSVALIAVFLYGRWLIQNLKKDYDLELTDTEIAFSKEIGNCVSKLFDEINERDKSTKKELRSEIEKIASQTPRFTINEKNEAILTMPDGKTEIYNYDLTNKKSK